MLLLEQLILKHSSFVSILFIKFQFFFNLNKNLDALGRSQCNMASIEKFLSIHINEQCQNYHVLREEAMKVYLQNINCADSEQVSMAFMRVLLLILF